MKKLSFISRRLWAYWFFFSGLLSFLLLYPLFRLFLSREKWFIHAWRLKTVWAHLILCATGIRYRIFREGKIDRKASYVICPNHSSYLDILMTNIAFPNYFHFIGKAELLKVPLFNIFFKRMNIAVNRKSIRDSHKAYERAQADLNKGISIAIFPEATIPDCSPALGPFKAGAFKLAIDKQVPLVPITFLDNWYLFPDSRQGRMVLRPGLSRIVIHEAVSTKGLTEQDVPVLMQQVAQIISARIQRDGRLERYKKPEPEAPALA